MANSDRKVVEILNTLVETCKDGEQGFKTAAEGVRDAQLREEFLSYARQRSDFAGELQAEIRWLGGQADRGGSVAGSLHRGWMNIRAAIAGGDRAIIAEAERGEDSAKASYEEALGANLPEGVRPVVELQYASVKEAHDRIRMLRERAA